MEILVIVYFTGNRPFFTHKDLYVYGCWVVGGGRGFESLFKHFTVVKWKIDFSALNLKGIFLNSLSKPFCSQFLSQIDISDMRCCKKKPMLHDVTAKYLQMICVFYEHRLF